LRGGRSNPFDPFNFNEEETVRILIPEAMHADAVALLREAGHDVVHDASLRTDPVRLMREAPLADAFIVRNRTEVRGELLRALGRARVVGRLGVGLDNIDLDACRDRGIQVIPAIGGNSRTVAEYILTSAMILLRGAAVYGITAAVAAGEWPQVEPGRGREIAGLRLGIVGYGSIGRNAAQIAQGLGMSVAAYARSGEEAVRTGPAGVQVLPLEQLLATSDVLSVNLPITAETRNFISAARIAQMKKGAVLVNTARGGVVDEHALVKALREGLLGGAAVDVFQIEPLPAGSAFADPPANLILTPHIAGVTSDAEFRVADIVARRVIEVLADQPA
jgi:(S)-sulfolactate dehydrogenase